MKILTILLFTLSTPAFATTPAPDCWTINGNAVGENSAGQEIADGQFLVTVDVPAISKEDLVKIMGKMQFGNLKPGAFPTIIENIILFFIDTVKEGAERNALKEAVSLQISEIAGISGVKNVECNQVARPSNH